MTTKTRYKIEYLAVLTLIIVLNLVPYRLALMFGDFIGFLAFSVIRIRREVTLDNLKKSFGDKYSDSEYRKIAAGSYRNIARGFIEYGLFPKLSKRDLSEYLCIEGEENIKKIKDSGRGAVLVTGHFGSWELMGAFIARRGWPIDYLVGEQHNLLVNKLMNDHRRLFNIGLIEMGVAARGVFKAVKEGRMVCMLSDQDAGNDGVVVDFLGRPASTPKGPAAFAIKTGAPLACGFIVRNGARQKIIVEPVIEFHPSGSKENDIKKLTQIYTSLIEKYVRRYPDHWFWPHRRWKSTT
ncbi:MAG: lysophospholipid acyltransferase family protein [Candidatus Zixiibacteriota bacterium]|nr:MAG: lysophospholipid acyltransferase family protein [candidate division Zixibacteria bacterium]